jgi:Polyketide synthase modules and related proteins
LACEEVASGKQEGALVGSSSLCINPHPSLQFQALGLLTNDPVSRPLDENGKTLKHVKIIRAHHLIIQRVFFFLNMLNK